jgi:glycosyltransferase involved in cell wall biosynthesis
MRITFLSPPFATCGGHRVMATYANRLKRRGHEVFIVAPPMPKPRFRSRVRHLIVTGRWPKSFQELPSDSEGRLEVPFLTLDRYRPVGADDLPDADVLISTWWETAEWAAALPAEKGAKVYFLQHYEAFYPEVEERVVATWRLPYHKIVVARWLADLARDRFEDPDAALVPNAVDQGLFHAPPRGKNQVPTVGLMYTSASFKRCDVALNAFRLFAARYPEARLIAFGTSAPGPHLPLPRGTEFHYMPRQAKLRELYARCDAWLFSSDSEGFGLPILEAMACRTPVVGTPAGAAPELIGQGGGYLVGRGDSEDLADALGRLWALPETDWRSMSDAAHATATRYTWDDATDLFEAALLRTAGRPGVGVR